MGTWRTRDGGEVQIGNPRRASQRRAAGPCGKFSFTSREKAIRSHTRAHARLRTYYCGRCLGWHVTNNEKRW